MWLLDYNCPSFGQITDTRPGAQSPRRLDKFWRIARCLWDRICAKTVRGRAADLQFQFPLRSASAPRRAVPARARPIAPDADRFAPQDAAHSRLERENRTVPDGIAGLPATTGRVFGRPVATSWCGPRAVASVLPALLRPCRSSCHCAGRSPANADAPVGGGFPGANLCAELHEQPAFTPRDEGHLACCGIRDRRFGGDDLDGWALFAALCARPGR